MGAFLIQHYYYRTLLRFNVTGIVGWGLVERYFEPNTQRRRKK